MFGFKKRVSKPGKPLTTQELEEMIELALNQHEAVTASHKSKERRLSGIFRRVVRQFIKGSKKDRVLTIAKLEALKSQIVETIQAIKES